MGVAEMEAEIAVIIIRCNFFLISNPQYVKFTDASGKYIVASELDKRPVDFIYFTFHFIVYDIAVDGYVPDKKNSIEFSLRLP